MKILIAGATGFIGKELSKALLKDHEIIVLGRDKKHLEQCFANTADKVTWSELKNYDAKQIDIIINLAGSNIGAKRWTPSIKKELIESRTETNKQLTDWLIKYDAHPHYYCANAVGIYGAYDTDSASFDEDQIIDTNNDQDFLKQIGLLWERSLNPAIERGIKVTTLRFGVVLKKHEGMLKKLELPFSLGLGSTLGTGAQTISWVHYQDLVNAILFLLAHPDVTGTVNITSPHPVSQKEFAVDFAHALHRPLLFKTPSFAIKIMFGEMGEYLLLKGQKVLPKRLIALGFKFSYPNLAAALQEEYQK